MLKKIFQTKIRLPYMALIVLGTAVISAYTSKAILIKEEIACPPECTNPLDINRIEKHKFTRPMLLVDFQKESTDLWPLKVEIENYIKEQTNKTTLLSSSVYIKDLKNGEWTTINPQEKFHPGSLFKLPMMIYYLKESEFSPDLLNKKLMLTDAMAQDIPAHTFQTKRIELNKEYTIRELLAYMIKYSDNYATYLLNINADLNKFSDLFKDLNLTVPDMHDINYSISAKDYALFTRILYNGTYLKPETSDFALQLLVESDFAQGIIKNLPSNTTLANKYGEMSLNGIKELHESGLVYYDKNPYLVVIMTKGKSTSDLAEVISTVSEKVYHTFVQ